MSLGGSTTTTGTTSSIPDWAAPYYQDVLSKAKTNDNLPYQPYMGQRLAQFSGDTTNAFDMVRQQAAAGVGGLTSAASAAGQVAGFQPGTINSQDVTAGTVNYNNPVTAQNITSQGIPQADLSGYLNPYTQNVLDVQMQQAQQQYAEQQGQRDQSAIQAGAFGGDRRFVQNSLAQRDLNNQLQSIESTGLNTAYNQATGLYETDQARNLQAQQANAANSLNASEFNASNLLNAGEFNTTNQLNAATGNATRGLSAATSNADNARLAASLRLQAAGQQGILTQDAYNQQGANAQALSQVGSKEQQQQQAGLDVAYQDFLRQQNYPADQLATYASILSGTASAPKDTTTSTTTPAPDFLSQLIGLGTTGVGLAGLLG